MNSVIEIKGLKRRFGSKRVLNGLDAEARRGRVIGLLGRNGEGKTTLFKILLDMLAKDAGTVSVLGTTPDGSGGVRQKIGYVPERPVFHPFMTIAEVFDLRRRFFTGWRSERAGALAARLGLDPNTRVGGASKGTLGKTAWVCAAAHDPELFLLDEPTSGLDALVRDEVLESLIGELHDSGKTIVVANHRMEELAGILDEIWLMSGGVISAVHEAEALRTQACRITGRLKGGAAAPKELGVVDLGGGGPLAEWAAFDSKTADRALSSGLLESPERVRMEMGATLKLLLKSAGTGGGESAA